MVEINSFVSRRRSKRRSLKLVPNKLQIPKTKFQTISNNPITKILNRHFPLKR